ncbi:hypothetical protein AGMMS49949_07380 [Alphaproteobacteria bacterium]|nr:hypothetical protein AGMMS49949_07380 [Alphaproteobacteria bacterium]
MFFKKYFCCLLLVLALSPRTKASKDPLKEMMSDRSYRFFQAELAQQEWECQKFWEKIKWEAYVASEKRKQEKEEKEIAADAEEFVKKLIVPTSYDIGSELTQSLEKITLDSKKSMDDLKAKISALLEKPIIIRLQDGQYTASEDIPFVENSKKE